MNPEMLARVEMSLARHSRAARLFEERLVDLKAGPGELAALHNLRWYLAKLLSIAGQQLGDLELRTSARHDAMLPERRDGFRSLFAMDVLPGVLLAVALLALLVWEVLFLFQ